VLTFPVCEQLTKTLVALARLPFGLNPGDLSGHGHNGRTPEYVPKTVFTCSSGDNSAKQAREYCNDS
jgi:hypothetical protein